MSLPLEAPRDWYPGTAISLGEMMRVFESAWFFRISRVLTEIEGGDIAKVNPNETIRGEDAAIFVGIMRDLRNSLSPVGLDFTIDLVDRIERSLQSGDMTFETLRYKLTDIHERLDDELKKTLVLQIPKERSEHFEKADGFGPEVSARFPEVGFDLEEAHTCYALGRYNAAVYHLMRVVESGVQRFGNDLGLVDTHKLPWGEITSQCHAKIRALSAGAEKVQRNEAMNHLDGVRSVWRNNTMHPRPTAYTETQARDILTNANALMVSLAEFL